MTGGQLSFMRDYRRGALLACILSIAAGLAAWAPGAAAAQGKGQRAVPIIFVHGHSGSAQQFETNAMRLTSNGFPRKRLFAYEWNTNVGGNDEAVDGLDGFIGDVKAQTGARRVDVLAHSRGTTVMHEYLSTPERARSVRRYVNFDGRSSDSPPGGVPTMAIWGEGSQTRAIEGAQNLYFPEKAHTEVTTSRAAFLPVYRFLTGRKARTGSVVPQRPPRVRVSGRALIFPDNAGMAGATLRVWELRRGSGQRKPRRAIHTQLLGEDGSFGPVRVNGRKRYEFEVARPGEATLHNYPEPFERSNHFYRVLNAPLLQPFIDAGPNHAVVGVTRMKEFWGDQPRVPNTDRLELYGENVLTPAVAPRARRVIAVFNFDKNSDQASDTSQSLFPFNTLPFLTGVDIFLPANADAQGSITARTVMRGNLNRPHAPRLNVPRWASDQHLISLYFKDYSPREFRR